MSDDLDALELAAVRKIIWELGGGYDELDHDADNLMDAAVAAAGRMAHLEDRVAELEADHEAMAERLNAIERSTNPDPKATPYHDLSRDQKVRLLREKLIRLAEDDDKWQKSRMTYREVLTLFDNKPSAGHAYQLMKSAADAEGFRYDADAAETNRIVCNPEYLNAEDGFHGVNNDIEGTGAEP